MSWCFHAMRLKNPQIRQGFFAMRSWLGWRSHPAGCGIPNWLSFGIRNATCSLRAIRHYHDSCRFRIMPSHNIRCYHRYHPYLNLLILPYTAPPVSSTAKAATTTATTIRIIIPLFHCILHYLIIPSFYSFCSFNYPFNSAIILRISFQICCIFLWCTSMQFHIPPLTLENGG